MARYQDYLSEGDNALKIQCDLEVTGLEYDIEGLSPSEASTVMAVIGDGPYPPSRVSSAIVLLLA